MNNSTFTQHSSIFHRKTFAILTPIILMALLVASMNILSIIIILTVKCLRRAANYPIVSVLIGASVQGLLTAPTYIYKRLDDQDHPAWVCDFYRFPYFLCNHMLKISLMVVSVDRLVAIKFPYTYRNLLTKRTVGWSLCFIWIFVILIDLIPFIPEEEAHHDLEGCSYKPQRTWALCVIVAFNIIPFVVIAVNYSIIWSVAVKIRVKDVRLTKRLTIQNNDESVENILSKNASQKGMEKDVLMVDYSKNKKSNEEHCSIKLDEKLYQNLADGIENCDKEDHDHSKERLGYMLKLAWELKATKTSLLLIMVYLVCWGPIGLLYLIDNYCLHCISDDSRTNVDRLIVKLLSFQSSIFIPLFYCWRTKEFQKAISNFMRKNILRKCLQP